MQCMKDYKETKSSCQEQLIIKILSKFFFETS